MGNVDKPSYGSVAVNGQLLPVLTASAFQPGPAVGPVLSGYGQAPLATLPSGNYGGVASGGGASSVPGNQNGITTSHMGIALAVMFLLGILGLEFVHWRA